MNENKPEVKLAAPPRRRIFEIGRFGLPLDLSDNVVCSLVILLAIALQVRFNNTFLGEGWLALLGFLGYLGIRYWLLKRRYPSIDELVVDEAEIFLPACIGGRVERKISFEDIKKIEVHIMKGRNFDSHSSLVIFAGQDRVKINWLSVELGNLEKELQARGLKVQRKTWNPAIYFMVVTLIFVLLGALIYLLKLS